MRFESGSDPVDPDRPAVVVGVVDDAADDLVAAIRAVVAAGADLVEISVEHPTDLGIDPTFDIGAELAVATASAEVADTVLAGSATVIVDRTGGAAEVLAAVAAHGAAVIVPGSTLDEFTAVVAHCEAAGLDRRQVALDATALPPDDVAALVARGWPVLVGAHAVGSQSLALFAGVRAVRTVDVRAARRVVHTAGRLLRARAA